MKKILIIILLLLSGCTTSVKPVVYEKPELLPSIILDSKAFIGTGDVCFNREEIIEILSGE